MLKKIISSGQTEAEQAALDAAIKLGVPHGGWIPKRKLTETGALPPKYRLQEMDTDKYSECIEQNVIDSKGTLILSCGKPTGNLDFARKMTLKHRHQLLGIDLDLTNFIAAASLVHDWIQLRHIDALYVTGSGATVNPDVGNHTTFIVESAILLSLMNDDSGSHVVHDSGEGLSGKSFGIPKTVNEAVEQIILEMSLQDRVKLANLKREDMEPFGMTFRIFIRNRLFQKGANRDLIKSCIAVSGNDDLNEGDAAFVIIEKLWEKLKETHKLKIVK
ncbi:MAG: putative molybdenum carrier protein [Desulfobacterales bacterium]